jgi:diguanylate cyclase (GGDEF)-like protein
LAIQIITRKDMIRHTMRRVAICVSVTVLVAWVMALLAFGTDSLAMVEVGRVTYWAIGVGATLAALLTAVLTYRTALMMQELTLTRAELLRISRTDQLTSLLNRRGFDEAAASALQKARTAKLPVVALMCDIDLFKAINDAHGHEFGDRVLIEISNVLRLFADETGILVARHGGEEFAALIVGTDNEGAVRYAEALRRACAMQVSGEGSSTNVTVSVGVTAPLRATDLAAIMRCADQALYMAKRRGRNRVVQVDPLAELIAA